MTLREIFQHAKRRTLPKEWLYLPADTEWTLDTDGTFLDWENEEKGEDEIPVVAKRNNLREALDDARSSKLLIGQIVWPAERTTQPGWMCFGIILDSMHSRINWERQIHLPLTRSCGASTESFTIPSGPSAPTPSVVTRDAAEARPNSASFAEFTSLSR